MAKHTPDLSRRRSLAGLGLAVGTATAVSSAKAADLPSTPFATVSPQNGQSLADALADAYALSNHLYLPAGDYLVDTALQIPEGVTLLGDGAQTRIIASESLSSSAVIDLQGVANVRIARLLLSSNHAAASGILANGVSGLSLEKVEFEGFAGSALIVQTSTQIGVMECHAYGIQETAFLFEDVSDLDVSRCRLGSCGSVAIGASDASSGLRIEHCNVWDCSGHGIEVSGSSAENPCSDIEIYGNRITNCDLGIRLKSVQTASVIANTVRNCQKHGLALAGSSRVRVFGNGLIENGSHSGSGAGIMMWNAKDSVVIANHCANNDQSSNDRAGILLNDFTSPSDDDSEATRGNVIAANVCIDEQVAPTQTAGIRVGHWTFGTPRENLLIGNRVAGNRDDDLIVHRELGDYQHLAHNVEGNVPGQFVEFHPPVHPQLPELEELPTPSAEFKGRMVLKKTSGFDDEIYICRLTDGNLDWVKLS